MKKPSTSTNSNQPENLEQAETIEVVDTQDLQDAQDSQTPVMDEAAAADAATNHEPVRRVQVSAAEAGKRIAELTNDLQRTRADFENYRKQIEVQKTQNALIARLATVNKFLPLIDNFERAIRSYPEQLAPLTKSFEKTLKEVGLACIDSEAGTEFNPDLHEAVMVEDSEGDTEVITETLRPGYMYDGSVVRTAMVKVKHQ